ncbi:protein kinase [Archangium violaceum]|uniref:serine/threonine protein kinase n=1 Tax=Archangium violaceum TaxID=83451 RepID=UPI00193BCEDD|nr:protein kinase [Archangium violaceum]QRK12198.1 protein kinase [Archangium violaceum]
MSIYDRYYSRFRKPSILFSHGNTDYVVLQRLVLGPGERTVYLCLPRTGFKEAPLVEIATLEPDASLSSHRRMKEEAELYMRMSHPGIPRFHGMFKRNGYRYLVTDYVSGFSLNMAGHYGCMRQQLMSESFIVYVALGLADILSHVHTLTDAEGRPLGVIHRSIDPYSVLLRHDGQVMLTKFVSAYSRLIGRESTNPYILRGEVDFAAPEYLYPPNVYVVVDARADLFSLGLVLVEMATGLQLYATDELEQAAALLPPGFPMNELSEEWLAEVECWTSVEDLSRRAAVVRPEYVEQMTQNVSEPLRSIFRKLLRRDPSERYATAAELKADLEECVRQWGKPYGPKEAMAELLEARDGAERYGPPEFRASDDDERTAGELYCEVKQ